MNEDTAVARQLAQGFIRLLEATLASFEHECGKRRPRQGELDRLDQMVKRAIRDLGTAIQTKSADAPRVEQVAALMLKDGRDEGVQRYLNHHRYSVPL